MKAWRIAFTLPALLTACGEKPAPAAADGRALALAHCSGCHAFPEPALLSRRTWLEQTLPIMGPRLGIHEHAGQAYPSDRLQPEVRDLFPERPLLTAAEWQSILDYYKDHAPEQPAPQQRAQPIADDLTLFDAVPVPRAAGSPPPLTTFVRIDPGNHLLWSGDGAENALTLYNAALRPVASLPAGGTVAFVHADDWSQPGARDFALTTMGTMHPSHKTTGTLLTGRMGADGQLLDGFNSVLKNLPRPVQITPCDLDSDGRCDWLVCGFGYFKGELAWHSGGTERHTLLPAPGCVRTIIEDLNGDARPDIWALFTQGRESLMQFTNDGGGKFSTREVLTFPAAQGSSSFDLTDLNGDGQRDLLYTCGDNADYSIELKAWHGVYLYLRDGDNFRQHTFFPLHGCTKALARDFDGDGDPDIAAIAHFPDFAGQPEEGFVFLENTGGLHFRARTMKSAATAGRWLVMDAADLDGDGDDDIALGNFTFASTPAPPEQQQKFESGPALLVLRNRTR